MNECLHKLTTRRADASRDWSHCYIVTGAVTVTLSWTVNGAAVGSGEHAGPITQHGRAALALLLCPDKENARSSGRRATLPYMVRHYRGSLP